MTKQFLAAGAGFFLWLGQLQPGVLSDLLPCLELPVEALALGLQLVIRLAELADGLLRKQLLQRPLLDVLCFILLQLRNEGNGALKDGALVLLAARNNLGELINALIDSLTATTLN